MSDRDRPPDFYWEGQARWKCPDCEFDDNSAIKVERHRIVHKHEEAFRRQVESGAPPNLEAAIREVEQPQQGQPPRPPLFDYANKEIKP